jgi:hypothetical protein
MERHEVEDAAKLRALQGDICIGYAALDRGAFKEFENAG